MADLLTVETAKNYVCAYHADCCDYGSSFTILGAKMHGDSVAVDVEVREPFRQPETLNWTVWLETFKHGEPARLYGEF